MSFSTIPSNPDFSSIRSAMQSVGNSVTKDELDTRDFKLKAYVAHKISEVVVGTTSVPFVVGLFVVVVNEFHDCFGR